MDLVFLIGVVYTITRTIRGILGGTRQAVHSSPRGERKGAAKAVQGQTVRDPVCGMFVSTEVSHRLVQGKDVLHFCSKKCLETYERKMAKV